MELQHNASFPLTSGSTLLESDHHHSSTTAEPIFTPSTETYNVSTTTEYEYAEEVGEVARIIARRYGEQSEKESDKNKNLGEELADVMFVVLCLANQTGIDLQASFDKKLDLKSKRDHDRHHGNEKLK